MKKLLLLLLLVSCNQTQNKNDQCKYIIDHAYYFNCKYITRHNCGLILEYCESNGGKIEKISCATNVVKYCK